MSVLRAWSMGWPRHIALPEIQCLKIRRGVKSYDDLVGGLEHEFYFSIQLGIVIPTD